MTGDEQSPAQRLRRSARQLIETEELLGGLFMPAEQNPLPAGAGADAAQAAPSADGASPHAGLSREDKALALAAIDDNEVKGCIKCNLCKSRTRTVFGEGDPDAELVFIGEGPGANEDATGRPFVGRAGELLNKMIVAMGLQRSQVYICNMVKCQPPGNRSPTPDESAACWNYLMRQLQIIQPEVIVTLGNPSTQGLLKTKTGITRLRGSFQELPDLADGLAGTTVMPTFHPAYLLRQYTPDNRSKVWSDLQKVMALLGLKAHGNS